MTGYMVTHNGRNVKHNSAFSRIAQNKRFEYSVAMEILMDSNELAADILVANGFTYLDEDNFAGFKDVAKFYGVEMAYVCGLTSRLQLTVSHCPDDVTRDSDYTKRFSARVILALSALMFAGQRIPANSKASRVYKNLTNSWYFKRAEEIKRKNEMGANAVNPEAARVFNDEIEVTPEGKIIISAEALAKVVRLAIAEPDKARVGGITKAVSREENKAGNTGGKENAPQKRGYHNQRNPSPVVAIKGNERKEFKMLKDCAAYLNRTPATVCRAAKLGCLANGYRIEYI